MDYEDTSLNHSSWSLLSAEYGTPPALAACVPTHRFRFRQPVSGILRWSQEASLDYRHVILHRALATRFLSPGFILLTDYHRVSPGECERDCVGESRHWHQQQYSRYLHTIHLCC